MTTANDYKWAEQLYQFIRIPTYGPQDGLQQTTVPPELGQRIELLRADDILGQYVMGGAEGTILAIGFEDTPEMLVVSWHTGVAIVDSVTLLLPATSFYRVMPA